MVRRRRSDQPERRRRTADVEPRAVVDRGHARARALGDEPRRGDIPGRQATLLDEGIESMSLNPDTVVETWMYLAGQKT